MCVTNFNVRDADLREQLTRSEKRTEDLDKVFTWSQKWLMLFNVGKCKVMHIGSSNPKFSYSLDGESLQDVLLERDLGVFIDSSMKPSKLCIEAAKRGNKVWV